MWRGDEDPSAATLQPPTNPPRRDPSAATVTLVERGELQLEASHKELRASMQNVDFEDVMDIKEEEDWMAESIHATLQPPTNPPRRDPSAATLQPPTNRGHRDTIPPNVAQALSMRSFQESGKGVVDMTDEELQPMVDEIFKAYDTDGDGDISPDEMRLMVLDTLRMGSKVQGFKDKNTELIKKMEKNGRRFRALGVLAAIVIMGLVAWTSVTMKSSTAAATIEVKQTVLDSKETTLRLDEKGKPHLLDEKTGQDVITRSMGSGAVAWTVPHPTTGRILHCMRINDAAQMTEDFQIGVDARISYAEPSNPTMVTDTYVLSNGDFHDEMSSLSFKSGAGAFKIMLDSDACNQAMGFQEESGRDGVESDLEEKEMPDQAMVPEAGNDTKLDTKPASAQETQAHLGRIFDRALLRGGGMVDLARSDMVQQMRTKFYSAHAAIRSGTRMLNFDQEYLETSTNEEDSPVVEVNDSGSFVGGLTCTESYVEGGNIAESAIDSMFAPLENSPLNLLEGSQDGQSINLVSLMKDELNNAISDGVGFTVLLPQKVCAVSEEDVATRGGNAGVEACEKLDMLGDTDVFAFGYYNDSWEKGICVALNDGTHTYALGQTGILPPIKIQGLEINILAIAISITKQLTATTLNEMWDGSDDSDGLALLEALTIPGHFVMRGTGSYGLTLSSKIMVALSIDATLLIDLDYANDGVAPDSNGAVDFAMMFSGQLTPTFELDVGKFDADGNPVPMELDLSAVFQVDADFYMYVNKDHKNVQMAVSRNLNLVEICNVNEGFAIFCDIFEQASFSMAVRSYANNDGFGVQFAIEATMEMKNGFDIVEDLIGWPADNQVSLALDIALMGTRLRTCVMFENTRFCTGKCTNDSECDEDQACDNTFKVCRKKRANGGKCGRDAGCISDNCVSGYCRECPTAGSTTDCTVDDGHPANYFCQRTFGVQTHVCRPQKNNGDVSGCSGDGACLSGVCLNGYCRACRNPGTVDTCTDGNVCQRNSIGTSICGPKKNNGDASGCSSNDVCESGVCLNGYCRACRTVGSTAGCANDEVCQNNSVGVNVCGAKKNNGSTCVANSICQGYCVSGFCRDCPTAGSTTGCSSGKFCQRLTNGILHTCQLKKDNGQTCSDSGACKSGVCTGGYCRVCTTHTHCSNQYGSSYQCYDNIKTGWIKKCCETYCSGRGIFRTCGHLRYCKS